MPRRKDSFARALADARTRLNKAQAERTAAQARLVALDAEIPRLWGVIASLDPESVNEKPATKPPVPGFKEVANLVIDNTMTPEQVKKLAEQATGKIRGGSIPYGGVKPPAPPVSEEEMLPNPEGEEIID